jgi:cysteine desulfurase/selenocysteine lyase
MVITTSTIRDEFPALRQTGMVYLDSAAKTLTCRSAIQAMLAYYSECDANVDRGVHYWSREASLRLESARSDVANLIGADPTCIVFTRGTTEAINILAAGIHWHAGDRIITSQLEHHSNLLPWLRLRQLGVSVEVLPVGTDGFIAPDDMKKAARGARLVTFTHASNSLGTVQDVDAIAAAAKEGGALVVIDGAQAAASCKLNVNTKGIDAYVFSGHKMFGPTGTGVLWATPQLLSSLEPLLVGGGPVKDSSSINYELANDYPYKKHECGTPNIAGLIGFGAAVRFLAGLDRKNCQEHIKSLVSDMLSGLSEIPRVKVFGSSDASRRIGVVSFIVEGLSPHKTAARLDEEFEVLTRSGHHCALVMWKEIFGQPEGAVRASVHIYTVAEEVYRFIQAVAAIAKNP